MIKPVITDSIERLKKERRIHSFAQRPGRLTPAQKDAFTEGMPRFGIEYKNELLDFQTLCNNKDVIFEIGCGMGETSVHIAKQFPQKHFIGLEVYTPGIGSLCKKIIEENVTNLSVIQHDAVEVLRDMIPNHSLSGVHVFFPDPWHKAKHNKRRIIQPEFIAFLSTKMKKGAYIHLATDWQEYALQMLNVLSLCSDFINPNDDEGFIEKPDYRPLTKFENRGINLGHGVWDLVFIKK